MPIDLDDIPDRNRKDFRRANGAPMWVNAEGKNIRASRPSGWGKVLDDENALVNWKLNRSIVGVAKRPDLVARAVALKEDDKEGWGKMREEAINSGRGAEAADIGTAIHAMTERWEDPDDDFDPGEPYTAHLEAYAAELDRLGLRSVLFEYHVVNERFNSAGTVDRLFELTKALTAPDGEVLPVGTLVVGDLKTGKKLDFSKPGYAVQLAIYAGGRRYNVETDEFMETPEVNRKWGLLIHQPSDNPICEAVWVDLDVGDYGAVLVQQVRMWRAMWRSGEFDMPLVNDPVSAPAADLPTTMADEIMDQALSPEPFELAPGDEYLEQLKEADEAVPDISAWLQERIDQIKHYARAKAQLMNSWPAGVPTPKKGTMTYEQQQTIDVLLNKIEADHSLPFVSGDPRCAPTGEPLPLGLH